MLLGAEGAILPCTVHPQPSTLLFLPARQAAY